MGEEVCACILLKSGEKSTPEDIKAFCKGKVGALTHPNLWYSVLHPPPFSLPTTPPTVPSPNPMIPTQPHA